jgi:hypothetical protein
VQYYEINSLSIDMFMQRHSNGDTLGDVRPIQLHFSSYCRNFYVFGNDTWDIQADDIEQTDGMLPLTSADAGGRGRALVPGDAVLTRGVCHGAVYYNLTKSDPYGPFNTSDPDSLNDAFQRLVRLLQLLRPLALLPPPLPLLLVSVLTPFLRHRA